MPISKYNRFVIGVIFIIVLIVGFVILLPFNKVSNSTIANDPLIVATDDVMVFKQLSEADLLPVDAPLVTFIDPQRGTPNPKVDLVEFSDFGCPFCEESQTAIRRLILTYPNTLRHVWKDAPNEALHPGAINAHLGARCAQKQNKFWEYHDILFTNQFDFSTERLKNITKNIGLNTKQWEKCFNDRHELAKIERNILEAEVLGIDATPSFFINKHKISGSVSYEELQEYIIIELNKLSVQ